MSTRREFLKQAAVAGAALGLSETMKAVPTTASPKVIGANDKIRMAVIGVHNRGKAIAMNTAKIPSADVAVICDCDSSVIPSAQDAVEKNCGKRPEAMTDIRKLMERDDIDAVAVATPDHWHAAAAIMAMKAGKHVYLEKPTCYCPAENQMLLDAQKKYGSVVQVGMQRRSYDKIREAIEFLRNGGLGEVRYAKSWYSAARPSIGKFEPSEPPATLDWDMWQGPAPRVKEFKANMLHYNWHWFWNWGTGEALNNGTHFVDLVRWGLGLDEYPTEVASVGGKYRFEDDDWETPDTQMVTFQFGSKCSFSWEGRSRNRVKTDGFGYGVAFYGDENALILTGKNEYKVVRPNGKVIKDVKSDLQVREGDIFNPSEASDIIHMQNFFDAIRKGTPLNDPLIEGCISTMYMQYGNIAQRLGRSIKIDPKTGRIPGDAEANKFWSRKYEKGWMPKI